MNLTGTVSIRTSVLTAPSAWNVLSERKKKNHIAYKGYISIGKYKCFINYGVLNKSKILYYYYFHNKYLLALFLISLEGIWFNCALESN